MEVRADLIVIEGNYGWVDGGKVIVLEPERASPREAASAVLQMLDAVKLPANAAMQGRRWHGECGMTACVPEDM